MTPMDLGEFSMLFRSLSEEERDLERRRATGALGDEEAARLLAIGRVLDETDEGLSARRVRRGADPGGTAAPTVVDKYFSHTLRRWPRWGRSARR
jgi:hypothetical protein